MNLLQAAAEWLDEQRTAYLSVPVEYIPRNGTSLTVNAPLGRTLFRAENEYGTTIRIASRDFLISASQLAFEPQRSDRIICDGKEYEVLAPNSEPVWRWADPSRITCRIHTKEIGNA